MRFLVIAACVDARTGLDFQPGDEFLPEPDLDQAERLIKAGCLRQIDDDAPMLPVDGHDGPLVTQLRGEIAALTDQLGTARSDVAGTQHSLNDALAERDRLKDENAKLREDAESALSQIADLEKRLAAAADSGGADDADEQPAQGELTEQPATPAKAKAKH